MMNKKLPAVNLFVTICQEFKLSHEIRYHVCARHDTGSFRWPRHVYEF